MVQRKEIRPVIDHIFSNAIVFKLCWEQKIFKYFEDIWILVGFMYIGKK